MANLATTSVVYTKPQYETPLDVAYAASLSIDLSARTNINVGTLTGNISIAFTNKQPGMSGYIRLVQDATGSRTLTLSDSFVKKAGGSATLSTGANKIDILSFIVTKSDEILVSLVKDFS